MALIHLISIGKLSDNFRDIGLKYEKMIKWNLKCTEIHYSKKLSLSEIKAFEGKLIDKYLDPKNLRIGLNVIGKNLDSYEFSKIFTNNLSIDFIIGGAFGLDEQILKSCNILFSISLLTMPHQLVKIILLEQIYRSYTLNQNHPYHK